MLPHEHACTATFMSEFHTLFFTIHITVCGKWDRLGGRSHADACRGRVVEFHPDSGSPSKMVLVPKMNPNGTLSTASLSI